MPPSLEQQLANLRLEINALAQATKTVSVPEAVSSVRNTMKWSAIVIAIALVISSLIRMATDERVKTLEKRVEALEKSRSM
jgi:ABC-type sulfate transport system permease component